MENKLDRSDYLNYSEATKLTLGDVMRRYISEGYHVNKKDKSKLDEEEAIRIYGSSTITTDEALYEISNIKKNITSGKLWGIF